MNRECRNKLFHMRDLNARVTSMVGLLLDPASLPKGTPEAQGTIDARMDIIMQDLTAMLRLHSDIRIDLSLYEGARRDA